jgi:hypothetical protein
LNEELEPPMKAFRFDLNLREKALFTKCYKLNFEMRFKGWEKMRKEYNNQEDLEPDPDINKHLGLIEKISM